MIRLIFRKISSLNQTWRNYGNIPYFCCILIMCQVFGIMSSCDPFAGPYKASFQDRIFVGRISAVGGKKKPAYLGFFEVR